jgi:hypothetical protein
VVQAPPDRRSRGSRASTVALLVAALVATGGVSFAIGRWSTGEADGESPAIGAGPSFDFAAAGTGAFPRLADGAVPAGPAAAVEVAVASDTETSTSEAAAVDRDSEQSTVPGSASEPESGAAQLDPPDTVAADLPGLVSQTPSAGDGPSGADGPPAGVFGDGGGFPGFSRGIEGSISAIEDGQLTIVSSDGTSSTVLVDASTEVLRQEASGVAVLEVGDSIRIVPGFGAGPRGALAPGGDPATGGDPAAGGNPATRGDQVELTASQVVLLESGGA